MSPEMSQALATAVKQWHEAVRLYEQTSLAFADAQRQMQTAERDLHELSRALEVATGAPLPAELLSKADSPIGAVVMPIRPVGPTVGTAADGVDAAAIVLEQMQAMRMGNP